MKKRLLSSFMAFLIVCSLVFYLPSGIIAKAYNGGGILNNGLGGIYIDIYGSEYNRYWECGNPYGTKGCTWFAGARVKELTGKGNYVTYSGDQWYDWYGESLGFTCDGTPAAGSVIVWSGHVAILEKIEGNTAYISEGGVNDSAYAVNDYCRLSTCSVSSIPGRNSNFKGYVHFESSSYVNLGDDFFASIMRKDKGSSLGVSNDNVEYAPHDGAASLFWHFYRLDDGSYKMYNCSNGKALSVENASTDDKANVVVSDYIGGAHQQWFPISTADGGIKFKAKNSGKVLDSAWGAWNDGANILVNTAYEDVNQVFSIYKHPGPVGVDIGDDRYIAIQKADTWSSVGMVNDNVQIVNHEGGSWQIWHLEKHAERTYRTNTYYVIRNCANKKVMTVQDNQTDDLSNVIVSEYTGGDNQLWYLTEDPNGGYVFTPKNCDKALYAKDNSSEIGTNISIYRKHGGASERYAIYSFPGASCKSFDVTPGDSIIETEFNWKAEESDTYDLNILILDGDKFKEYKKIEGITSTSYNITLPNGDYKAYVDCRNSYSSRSSDSIVFTIKGSVHDHNYVDEVISPTCTFQGYTTHTCSDCGDSYTDSYTKPTGHTYEEKIITPTYESDGYTLHVCKVCGDSYKDNYIPKLNKLNISTCTATLSTSAYTYNGTARKPAVTVKNGSTVLKNGTDYTVTYKNIVNAGTATVTITGKGSYTGSKTLNFKINAPTPTALVKGMKVSRINNNSALVTWTKGSGYTDQYVYVSENGGSWTRAAKVSAATNSYTFKNLKAGTSYKFAVKTVNTVSGKDFPAAKYAQVSGVTTLPKVSGAKVASTKYNSATVSWNKVSGAKGYYVYQYDTAAKTWKNVKTVTANSVTISGLKSGTAYKFAVRAYKTVGTTTVKSEGFDTLTGVTTLPEVKGITYKPAQTRTTMSWTKVNGATGYYVYQYNNITKKWSKIKTVSANSVSISGLKAGTSYNFTVRAYKTVGGKTVMSDTYKGQATSTNPAKVTFKVASNAKGKAAVSWNKVTGATGYIVYYKTSANGTWQRLTTSTGSSYTKTGLKSGSTYYFTVKAYRTVGGKTYNGSYGSASVKVK